MSNESNEKPNKYERSRRIKDEPSKLDRLWNPYSKVRNTVSDILNKEDVKKE